MALVACRLVDERRTAAFIADELCRTDLDADWRNELIRLAEQTQFEDALARAKLGPRLLELAITLRASTEAGITDVVFSAIRMYASMIDARDAGNLLPLLLPPSPIETRLVTLQCIVHIFESRPPSGTGSLKPLADRVFQLASKFLDPDLLIAGEKAAIGQNAVHALAALGDERLAECVAKVKVLALPWLTRQLTRKLASTLSQWEGALEIASWPGVRQLREQLAELQEHHVLGHFGS